MLLAGASLVGRAGAKGKGCVRRQRFLVPRAHFSSFDCFDTSLKLGQRFGRPQGHAFELQSMTTADAWHGRLLHFSHGSGAQYYHLECPSDFMSGMVGVRTAPEDRTGVTHVLERVVLQSCVKFPTPQSGLMTIAPVSNAATSHDTTTFGYTTYCEMDARNLMQTYLNYAFFPSLRDSDFETQARLEFDASGRLQCQGVIHNEMKAALGQDAFAHLTDVLFAGSASPYQHSSLGDPVHIPDFDSNAARAYHAKTFRPENAAVFTMGGEFQPKVLTQLEQDWLSPYAIEVQRQVKAKEEAETRQAQKQQQQQQQQPRVRVRGQKKGKARSKKHKKNMDTPATTTAAVTATPTEPVSADLALPAAQPWGQPLLTRRVVPDLSGDGKAGVLLGFVCHGLEGKEDERAALRVIARTMVAPDGAVSSAVRDALGAGVGVQGGLFEGSRQPALWVLVTGLDASPCDATATACEEAVLGAVRELCDREGDSESDAALSGALSVAAVGQEVSLRGEAVSFSMDTADSADLQVPSLAVAGFDTLQGMASVWAQGRDPAEWLLLSQRESEVATNVEAARAALRAHVLDSPHRATIILEPDADLIARFEEEERQRMDKKLKELGDEGAKRVREAQARREREASKQPSEADAEAGKSLPHVAMEQIPPRPTARVTRTPVAPSSSNSSSSSSSVVEWHVWNHTHGLATMQVDLAVGDRIVGEHAECLPFVARMFPGMAAAQWGPLASCASGITASFPEVSTLRLTLSFPERLAEQATSAFFSCLCKTPLRAYESDDQFRRSLAAPSTELQSMLASQAGELIALHAAGHFSSAARMEDASWGLTSHTRGKEMSQHGSGVDLTKLRVQVNSVLAMISERPDLVSCRVACSAAGKRVLDGRVKVGKDTLQGQSHLLEQIAMVGNQAAAVDELGDSRYITPSEPVVETGASGEKAPRVYFQSSLPSHYVSICVPANSNDPVKIAHMTLLSQTLGAALDALRESRGSSGATANFDVEQGVLTVTVSQDPDISTAIEAVASCAAQLMESEGQLWPDGTTVEMIQNLWTASGGAELTHSLASDILKTTSDDVSAMAKELLNGDMLRNHAAISALGPKLSKDEQQRMGWDVRTL